MRILVLCLTLAAGPAVAEEAEPPGADGMAEGLRLFGEGARTMLDGLLDELGPQMRGLAGRLGDLNAYHPPEVLPNGDIILRRKQPLESEPPADGEVEI